MAFLVYLAGVVVIAGATSVGFVRWRGTKTETELQAFVATVPAPLTPDVRQWLAPQLFRRSVYPVLGLVWGGSAGQVLSTRGWSELPWFWFATLVSMGAGTSAGALVAALRTPPLIDSPRRAVDPVRRRMSDHYGSSQVLRLRVSLVVAGAALAVAVTILLATSSEAASAHRALLACGLGMTLVVAHRWVVATVVARPMVTSSTEGLLWQKALVAKTVEPMPQLSFFIAVSSAAIALFAAAVTIRDLPLPVLLVSAGLAVLTLASVVVVVVAIRDEKQPSPQQESTLP